MSEHRTSGLRLFWIGMVLWIAIGFLAAWSLKTFDLQGWRAYLLALASIAPALLMLAGLLGMIRRQDELYRRIQFEAIAFAAILVWFVTFIWGLLEILGLLPPLPTYWIATGLVFAYGFGGWYFRKRYQ
jgi:Kef-type K+ transport system membrane component KefB